MACLFSVVTVSLEEENLYILMKSETLLSHGLCLWYLRNLCLFQGHENVLLCFPEASQFESKLRHMFDPFPWVDFCIRCRVWVEVHGFLCMISSCSCCPTGPLWFVEKTVLSPMNRLGTFVKIHWPSTCGSLSGFSILTPWSVSIFSQFYSLGDCSFRWSLQNQTTPLSV